MSAAHGQAFALTPTAVAAVVRAACVADVHAFKPGNVSLFSAGHGMTAQDFITSAEAIAAPITRASPGVGARVLAAVAATRREVPCNTNLGIVLLLAPLVEACLQPSPQPRLSDRLQPVLARLDVQDAADAFAAIRLANPGGLGNSPRHDVREPARASLLEAMSEAAARDGVARQYANGYAEVFATGLPRVRDGLANWGREDWAVVSCYLGLLARMADTHIARKSGEAAAQQVSREAQTLDAILAGLRDPEELVPRLRAWDSDLKERGLNPGTTADLTVASLAALHLEALLEQAFSGSEATLSATG